MSYAKMIHDYIDGGLDSTNEQALFSMISRSDEIRREFNTQFKMHLAAQEEMSLLAPPLHVTNAVFTGLGLAMPSNYAQSPVATIKKFLTRFSPALLLLFFFGAIGWGIIEYQKNAELSAELAKLKVPIKNNIPVMSSFDSDKNENYKTDESVSSNSNTTKMNNRDSQRAYAARFESGTDNEALNLSNSNSGSDLNQNSRVSYRSESLSFNNSSFANPQYYALIPATNYKHLNNLKMYGNSGVYSGDGYYGHTLSGSSLLGAKYNIQIRRLDPTYVSPTLESSKLSEPQESYAVSFMYSINDFHALGLEIAKENFTQNFITSDGLQYSQSPEIYILGVNYRLTPKDLLIPYYLYPYLQQSAGYTTIGPVFKTQVGLIWHVASPVSFNLGFEYGALIYNVGGTIYNSNKLGITGGINIGF